MCPAAVATVAAKADMLAVMKQNHRPIDRMSGWLLFIAVCLSAAHGFGLGAVAWMSGLAFWLAGMLLAARLQRAQRVQTVLMIGVGAVCLSYAVLHDGQAQWLKALSANQALLAMLAGVSFLRMISVPEVDAGESDPKGRVALLRTLVGVHLFGAVINLSAVMILGDRQTRRKRMTPMQATVLSRGFALAALWSPFFAAMGIALSNAPGAQWTTLSAFGIPLAAIGLLFTTWQLSRRTESAAYVGYPMHFGALWIPAVLAALVLVIHQLQPDLPILTLISVSAICLTVSVLIARGPASAFPRLHKQITEGLPRMSGELALFLAAGVLAAGIASAVLSTGWQLDVVAFGAFEASILLVAMVAISIVGVHPVISIATVSGILAPISPDPDMMGMTYLMTWAAGVSSSPFSGMHLSMQGRFNIDAMGFVRWNASFTVLMLALFVAVLHLYEIWRG